MELRAHHNMLTSQVDFLLCRRVLDRLQVAQPAIITEAAEGTTLEPTFSLREEAVQGLMDALWQAGFRPKATGDPTALGRHLEDMRAIAFQGLGIEKP